VSLARAVYADQDIILMDDPISAVDAIVKRKIMKNVIHGYLKNKTRVLVTHAIDVLNQADKIILLDQGKILAQGTFDELKDIEHMKNLIKINDNNAFEVENAAA
jgi:ATP-binding cassette, subfamily C (CFTR/MRP), member 1